MRQKFFGPRRIACFFRRGLVFTAKLGDMRMNREEPDAR
jgi:hypothetical protein